MNNQGKARENRIRRRLGHMGYKLVKRRLHNPRALDFGKYLILDVNTNGGFELPDLNAVERYVESNHVILKREQN